MRKLRNIARFHFLTEYVKEPDTSAKININDTFSF